LSVQSCQGLIGIIFVNINLFFYFIEVDAGYAAGQVSLLCGVRTF
jgi:hypothetical protein